MTPDEYQRLAQRTAEYARSQYTPRSCLCNWAMGLSGEAGEFSELIKKHIFHGADLNKHKALNELGDILWYVAAATEELGSTLEIVMELNITKLKKRYPEQFTPAASLARKDLNEPE